MEIKLPDISSLNNENPRLYRELTQFHQDLVNIVNILIQHKDDTDKFAKQVSNDKLDTVGLLGVLTQPFINPNDELQGVNTNSEINTSQTANKFYASPDGSSGLPSFRSLVLGDIGFTIPLSKLDTKILKTNNNLTQTAGAFLITGKVTIEDNNGHSVDVLYT